MLLVEQELFILPEYMSSPPVFSGVCVTRSLVLCECVLGRCLSFCPVSFYIVLSVRHRCTDSDNPFGIFKLFMIPAFLKVTLLNLDIKELKRLAGDF